MSYDMLPRLLTLCTCMHSRCMHVKGYTQGMQVHVVYMYVLQVTQHVKYVCTTRDVVSMDISVSHKVGRYSQLVDIMVSSYIV